MGSGGVSPALAASRQERSPGPRRKQFFRAVSKGRLVACAVRVNGGLPIEGHFSFFEVQRTGGLVGSGQ